MVINPLGHFSMGGWEGWWAVMHQGTSATQIVPMQTGNSPEEAVANLWLALNK